MEAIGDGRPFKRPAIEARITVPADIDEILKADPQRAQEIQATIGEQFEEHFHSDLAVIGFEKTDKTGTYLLGQWESK